LEESLFQTPIPSALRKDIGGVDRNVSPPLILYGSEVLGPIKKKLSTL
jgi:hypothetical protein